MKILFMGTPDFAAVTLEKLMGSKHAVLGAVTQPDKQRGRGRTIGFSPVKELALKQGLPVYQPIKVKEPQFLQTVVELAPEAIAVVAFGQILPKTLLEIPPYGCINVHASLLPKYRGAAPIQYSIIEGDQETGVTIMYMDAGLDTGDIILQKSIPITAEDTGGSLHDKMAVLGADLLIEALERLERGTAVRIPQDAGKATYVRMLDKDMGKLDFTQPAAKLERLIRGLNPWPSAYTILDGRILKLWKASAEADKASALGGKAFAPGEVAELRRDCLVVATGEGALVIRELQLEGKKRMSADAFLRGYAIPVGTKLG